MKSWRTLNRETQNAAWDQFVQMLFYKAESADKKSGTSRSEEHIEDVFKLWQVG